MQIKAEEWRVGFPFPLLPEMKKTPSYRDADEAAAPWACAKLSIAL